MGALSRRKGAAYEQLITRLFRAIFGESVKRGIGQERRGSEIPDVAGVPGFWIQTKHGGFISIRDAVVQGEAEVAESGKVGLRVLAITRFNGERDLATMRLSDFAPLLAELHYRRQLAMELNDGTDEEIERRMGQLFLDQVYVEIVNG